MVDIYKRKKWEHAFYIGKNICSIARRENGGMEGTDERGKRRTEADALGLGENTGEIQLERRRTA